MWATLFNGVLGLLGGPFAKAAVDAYRAKLTAENTTEHEVAGLASKALELDNREAEINSRVTIAEQGNWATRWVRPMWAFPFVAWTFKAVFIDKVVCPALFGYTCSTDPLEGMVATLCTTIAVSYFGGRTIEKVASTVAGAWRIRKG